MWMKIVLEAKSSISQLPDSQKIFGSLVYMYAKMYGEECAGEFVRQVKTKEVKFLLSSLMPEHYIFMPKQYMINRVEAEGDNIDQKKCVEFIKDAVFIPENKLKLLTDGYHTRKTGEILQEIEADYIRLKYFPWQRSGIIVGGDGMKPTEPELYAVPKTYVIRKHQKKETEIKRFAFYVNYGKGLADFENMMKKGCQNGKILLLGRRGSQSNFYQMKEYKAENLDSGDSSFYLNIGKLLPEAVNYKESYLELFTSDRRPFSLSTALNPEWDKGCFISYIKEGSCICLENGAGLDDAGKSIDNPFNQGTILYGNSCFYPMGGLRNE